MKTLAELQREYRGKMRRLMEIRDTKPAEMTDEIRAERDQILVDVQYLMLDIDQTRDDGSSRNVPPDGAANDPGDGFFDGGQHQGRSARESGRGYEVRHHNDPKTYRDLFGREPRNQYRWQDREVGFWQALFSGRSHPALQTRAMIEGTPSDGGFLVPVEYSEMIHNVALENEVVFPRCTVVPMSSNEKRLPAMSIGDHSSNLFGGFTATYKAEEATMSEANPKTREMTLQAKKLTGFLKMSNELVNDLPRGEGQIIDICGAGLGWYR